MVLVVAGDGVRFPMRSVGPVETRGGRDRRRASPPAIRRSAAGAGTHPATATAAGAGTHPATATATGAGTHSATAAGAGTHSATATAAGRGRPAAGRGRPVAGRSRPAGRVVPRFLLFFLELVLDLRLEVVHFLRPLVKAVHEAGFRAGAVLDHLLQILDL